MCGSGKNIFVLLPILLRFPFPLAFPTFWMYTLFMDITALSTAMAQDKVQQSAAVQVQKMAMDGTKEQGAQIAKMMDSLATITDPSLGNKVNFLA